jgi:hypothetical protein
MRISLSPRTIPWTVVIVLVGVLMSPATKAGTIWNGPTTNFVQKTASHPTGSGTNDHLTTRVIINRGGNFPIYNQVLEGSANKIDSPKDTEWAFGTLANTNLTYRPFYTFATASSPNNVAGGVVGKDAVCHLKTDDIFLLVHFTAWGQNGTGSFAYTRSTPAAVAPTPTVFVTNPPSGTVYSAPADVKITAIASVSSGSVTNVRIFRSGTLIGTFTVSPYTMTASNLDVGTYNLTAVATAAGISATSPVVIVSVINPVPVVMTNPVISNGQFSFSYSADPGILYAVESSADLINWTSNATNSAAIDPTFFSEAVVPPYRFYRVARQPNR